MIINICLSFCLFQWPIDTDTRFQKDRKNSQYPVYNIY